MKPHAFVAMPFGTKPGLDGVPIDFNVIYRDYIRPGVEAAGLEVIRADEEQSAGSILTDMFQELLLADLVIADLTIDNPNVWYELGVRHGVRARGVVLICGGRVTSAFDLYTDRKLNYGLINGALDPATIDDDRRRLAQMVRETMESWHGRKISPVYYHLPGLQEPDWKSLRVGDVEEFWERHDSWERRIELASKAGRIGDVLVLAEEAPVAAFRAEAWIAAGRALRSVGRYQFALEQLDRGLAIAPDNLTGQREKGICLQRLALARQTGHSLERARHHYERLLADNGDDAETWALLGRVDKDAWVSAWRTEGRTKQAMRDEAAYEDALLRAAIDSYARGYRRDPGHFFSGVNALTLMQLHRHLTGDARFDDEAAMMAGAVRFAASCERREPMQFHAKATLGDVEVLQGTADSARKAYKEAIANSDGNWFSLSSCREQLALLSDLGFRDDVVSAGLAVFDRALEKLSVPERTWQPRKVLLFSGHMVDQPSRPEPRFPSHHVDIVRQKIAETLDALGVGESDLALTQGACGGDLLFSAECQMRGVKLQWLLPVDEPTFIEWSVGRGGIGWRELYFNIRQRMAADRTPRIAPDDLGNLAGDSADGDVFVRCNLWLLYTALAYGIDKLEFICLWNGGSDDGPGGTAHMYREVKARTGRIHWLDTRKLW
jgi:tetratricopeptide (TPR) repeat protein